MFYYSYIFVTTFFIPNKIWNLKILCIYLDAKTYVDMFTINIYIYLCLFKPNIYFHIKAFII